MVAHQTLTLFVRVRILHPLPQKPLELNGSGGFCPFDRTTSSFRNCIWGDCARCLTLTDGTACELMPENYEFENTLLSP